MQFRLELIPTEEKDKFIITEEMINKTLSYIKKLENELIKYSKSNKSK